MNIALPKQLTVDEFLAWGLTQPKEAGKLELLDGVVVVQQSQKWRHSRTKFEITIALREAIAQAGVAYFAAPEGPSVRINAHKCFEPDALVAALPLPAGDSLEIANPVIVVEVLSPSIAHLGTTVKRRGYFEVPSIEHYLIVDPDKRTIMHHKRVTRGTFETHTLSEGKLILTPPGIAIDVGTIFV